MPRQLTTPEDLRQASEARQSIINQVALLDRELELYVEDGPYRFQKERLETAIQSEKNSLEVCPLKDVAYHRARLQAFRYLANLPDFLRGERARLAEGLENV